jgi:hypothetical protein
MTIHNSLVEPMAIHPAAYVGVTDPGGVGMRKMWVDTSRGVGAYLLKLRSDDNTSWIILSSTTDVSTLALDKTGATDTSAAMQAWFAAKAGIFGGVNRLPTGQYKLSNKLAALGDAYTGLEVLGDGDGTLIINGTAGTSDGQPALITIIGSSSQSLKKVRWEKVRISGLGATDLTRLMSIDNCDEVELDHVTLENNGAEGIVSFGGGGSIRRVMFNQCRATNVGKQLGRAAWNLNADVQTIIGGIIENCGNAVETTGSFTVVDGLQIHDNSGYALMIGSTYSGTLNQDGSVSNSYGCEVHGLIVRRCGGKALQLSDYSGHANSQYPTLGPAHIGGNKGLFRFQGGLYDQAAFVLWGGADFWGHVDFSHNTISGQFDNGSGPQNRAYNPLGGYHDFHDNYIERGNGEKFAGIIGYSIAGWKGERMRISSNRVKDWCWSGGDGATLFNMAVESMVENTTFLDGDGHLAATPAEMLYRWEGPSAGPVARIAAGDFYWKDPVHRFSLFWEPSDIPLGSDTIPPFFTFKPGDTLRSRFAGATWMFKRCLTGGTTNPTALSGITGTGTSGTNTITLNSVVGLFKYCWITCAGVAAKQVIGITGNVLTLGVNLEASPSAAAISYATPTWATL